MHEHGEGLPLDLHLAKRRYDEALGMDQEAAVPVKLALAGLWLRMRFGETFLIKALDTLPEVSKSFSCAGRNQYFWKGVESFILDTLPEVSCELSLALTGCCACTNTEVCFSGPDNTLQEVTYELVNRTCGMRSFRVQVVSCVGCCHRHTASQSSALEKLSVLEVRCTSS